MKNIFKKFGLILASMLIMASVFGGVAMAQGNKAAIKNANLMNSTAAAISLSSDPVAAFKSLPSDTQAKVISNLIDVYQELNNAADWEIAFYDLSPAVQTLITVDMVYSYTETTYFINDSEGNILTTQDEQLARSISAMMTRSTYYELDYMVSGIGSLTGLTNWEFKFMLKVTDYGDRIYVEEAPRTFTYNGWNSNGQSNYKLYSGWYNTGVLYYDEGNDSWLYIFNKVAHLACVAYKFTHLLDTKYGYIENGIFLKYNNGALAALTDGGEYTNTSAINTQINSMSGLITIQYGMWSLSIYEF
ncbi:MAG: hypothetical protein FWF37_02740 [Chloroflexi bacterium]|nr:hypothetical protein [Chloroflexota bacterium]